MDQTFGELVDKLTICNLKIWAHEDTKRGPKATDSVIARACKATNILNQQRNDLIEALDNLFESAVREGKLPKSYGSGSTKKYGNPSSTS